MIPLRAKTVRWLGKNMATFLIGLWVLNGTMAQTPQQLESDASVQVSHYHLTVKLDPELKRIGGSTEITFRCTSSCKGIWVNLDESFHLAKVLYNGEGVTHQKMGDRRYLEFPRVLPANSQHTLVLYFGGAPSVLENESERGSFSWSIDSEGKPWIKGITYPGKSWWPHVPHAAADSMMVSLICPDNLRAIASGSYGGSESLPGRFKQFDWKIRTALSPQAVAVFLGDYIRMSDTHAEGNYSLPLNYYVLPGKESHAREQLAEVKSFLPFFDKRIGVYPLVKDGLTFVHAPGVRGEYHALCARPHPDTDHPLGFDLGLFRQLALLRLRSLCTSETRDRWLPEALSEYLSTLYIEESLGEEEAQKYLFTRRNQIQNRLPIGRRIEPEDPAPLDLFYKGSWIFHTLRQITKEESRWFGLFAQMGQQYGERKMGRGELERLLSQALGRNISPILQQYLTYASLPVFEYQFVKRGKKTYITYRWQASAAGFALPLEVNLNGTPVQLQPTQEWQELESSFRVRNQLSVQQEGLFEVRELP